jgi:hypothetical protein
MQFGWGFQDIQVEGRVLDRDRDRDEKSATLFVALGHWRRAGASHLFPSPFHVRVERAGGCGLGGLWLAAAREHADADRDQSGREQDTREEQGEAAPAHGSRLLGPGGGSTSLGSPRGAT